MSLAAFTVTATPGESHVTVNGQRIDGATRAVVEVGVEYPVPTLTVWTLGQGEVTGEGVVQVVRDPTPQEIDQAAVAALHRLDAADIAARVQQRLRVTPRADPYQTTLDVIVELADG